MRVIIDDIMSSKKQTLVNTVNCVGVMGKGIALEFKRKYPDMYKEYVSRCKEHAVRPGKPYLYSDLTGASVLLFPTKDHWRSPSKLEYIIDGLDWFTEHYKDLGITSVAFPPLGCGNGGLKWEVVGPIMYQKLSKLPIDVDIYAPFGTKKEYLTEEYLRTQDAEYDRNLIGSKYYHYNPNWLLALEVMRKVNAGKYTLHVGRVLFQKICYVLTREGVQTGFSFRPAWYGPYSEQVTDAITILSNSNFIIEKQHPNGKMVEISVSPRFKLPAQEYSSRDLKAMEKCIDLFSRVKNTQHAEIIATILYEFDRQRSEHKETSEEDVFNGVMNWEKRWKGTKDQEVRMTIRSLASLGWIDPLPSDYEAELI